MLKEQLSYNEQCIAFIPAKSYVNNLHKSNPELFPTSFINISEVFYGNLRKNITQTLEDNKDIFTKDVKDIITNKDGNILNNDNKNKH
jgi:hypothetical protein